MTPTEVADAPSFYRLLVELQADCLSLARPDGVWLYVNPALARLYQAPADALIRRNLFDFVPPEQQAELRRDIDVALATQAPVDRRNQVEVAPGRLRWMQWRNVGVRDESGAPLLHSVGRDIQEQWERERELKANEALFRLLAEASADVVIALDRNLVRTYVSPAAREMFGAAPEELVGKKTGEAAHPDDAKKLLDGLQELLDGGNEKLVGVGRRRHRDGHWLWAESCYRAVRDPTTGEVTGIVASVRDISARKAIEEELAEATQRLTLLVGQDGLTGLANRRAFDEALSREHKRASRGETNICLVMIDVDRFKAYNDGYGHVAGDECLKKVAGAIQGTLRRANDLAVRYGGEEFAVLAPSTDARGGGVLGEKIRRAVRELALPHAYSEYGVVTVSVGVAATLRSHFVADRELLLRRADAALYEAKHDGRDRVWVSSLAALPQTA